MKSWLLIAALLLFAGFFYKSPVFCKNNDLMGRILGSDKNTTRSAKTVEDSVSERLVVGLEIMMSGNGGFGLGLFYRHRLEKDSAWYWFVSFSIGDVKDDQEFEYYDYWTGRMVTPGKLNRFYALPLFAGVQYRLWKDDIADNFRPYVTGALGPAIVFSAPFIEEEQIMFEDGSALFVQKEIEFFTSLGRGRAHHTFGGYAGAGAFFGSLQRPIGLSARYVYIPVFGGLPSMGFGSYSQKKYNFGGFYIIVSFGL